MNVDSLKPLAVGAAGFASSIGVQAVEAVEVIPISEAVGVFSQIVILVATLIGLFKRNKENLKN